MFSSTDITYLDIVYIGYLKTLIQHLPWPSLFWISQKPHPIIIYYYYLGGERKNRSCYCSVHALQQDMFKVHGYICITCITGTFACNILTLWQYTTPKQVHFWHTLYTDVVLFSFLFFWKTSLSAECKKEKWMTFVFPHPYPLRWWLINPLRFIFYHAHSTDFEEKIEGLWTDYFWHYDVRNVGAI